MYRDLYVLPQVLCYYDKYYHSDFILICEYFFYKIKISLNMLFISIFLFLINFERWFILRNPY